ncbi:VOC family protein [Psychromicrobium xiongbiense]|uniref:VOC family protein n=1 Tax=Psychromicrobium xiongbiense TaxID=3051184 RepID=UPI0025542A1D|nr:VOC family protein [Psychromicrobium sp. YIM S02556]
MPTRDEAWPEGTPNWPDLAVSDPAAAATFYGSLFGWDVPEGDESMGGYRLVTKNGRAVAGISPLQSETDPSVWTTFFAADDAAATAAKVVDAGGAVFFPPTAVAEQGTMAVVADSTGAVFGLWQGGNHLGVGLFNEDGTLCWNELHTRDYAAARAFYTEVFGFNYRDINSDEFIYSTFQRASDGEDVGGMNDDPSMPEGHPNYWLTWFAADDVDATLAKAVELGATALMPASDSPFGRMTIVRAPHGEAFGLITLPAEQ